MGSSVYIFLFQCIYIDMHFDIHFLVMRQVVHTALKKVGVNFFPLVQNGFSMALYSTTMKENAIVRRTCERSTL